MESIDHMVGAVLSHLSESATSRAVAGEPIKVGDVTLVVLSTLSVGMGAGGGEGEGDGGARGEGARKGANAGPGSGVGEGAGGAARVRPAAVIAFTPNGVEVLTIPANPGPIDRMVEKVPEVVDMVERVRKSFEHRA